jgi:hypothetical protein
MLMSVACSDGGPEAFSEDELVEDLGTSRSGPGEVWSWTSLLWRLDGGAVFYVSTSPYQVKAVDVSTGATTVVDARHTLYYGFAISPDGKWLYFAAQDDQFGTDPPALYATSSDGNETRLLASNVALTSLAAAFVVSPDNVHVAYRVTPHDCYDSCPDSLFLHAVASGERVLLPGTGEPLAFAPDGGRLLIVDSQEAFILTIGTGDRQSVSLPHIPYRPADTPLFVMARWDNAGIRVTYLDTGGRSAFVYHVGGATETELPFALRGGELVYPAYAWSPDGSRTAWWGTACLGRCAFLHVAYVDGRGDEIVATASGETLSGSWGYTPGHAAFSPDNTAIAHVLNGQLHVTDLR